MQKYMTCPNGRLHLRRCGIGKDDRVVISEVDHSIAMPVGCDQRLQLLLAHERNDRVLLRIEVEDFGLAEIDRCRYS
ncbi:MAG: hypothetical protein WCD52_16610 [Xanthobacteraceae bacterium]